MLIERLIITSAFAGLVFACIAQIFENYELLFKGFAILACLCGSAMIFFFLLLIWI